MIDFVVLKMKRLNNKNIYLAISFKKFGFASLQECEASLNPEEEQDPILWI